jgi:hypothetical protein
MDAELLATPDREFVGRDVEDVYHERQASRRKAGDNIIGSTE